MKILIKIWWSLLAPKNTNKIDFDYLEKISTFVKNLPYDVMIVHWTWNVGHGWVSLLKKNFLGDLKDALKKDYLNGRKKLDDYFCQIDKFFWFKRKTIEDFLMFPYFEKNTIVSGDVLENWEIISSDDIFQMVLKNSSVDLWLVLTDVDGVLDKNCKVIAKISNLDNVFFWEKENDVTWWMKAKVEKLLWLKTKIIISNGHNLENVSNWIFKWSWVWTVIG